MDIKNKIILVAGATGAIGEGLVRKLDQEGARLILVSRSKEKLEKLANSLGGDVKFYVCDFLQRDQISDLIIKLSSDLDSVDILINAAGIGVYEPIEEVAIQAWDNSFAINVTALFLITQGLLGLLGKSKSSLVLNLGSGAGRIPMCNRSVYCTAKFALRGFTLSLAEEFIDKSPNFCLITLGSTLTEFGPLTLAEKKRLYEEGGKSYLTVDFVVDKLVNILKLGEREVEYIIYPSDYGKDK